MINGLCDRHHPCQALADFLTIREAFGVRKGLRVVFIGDVNNVCRSLAWACLLGGADLVISSPAGYGLCDADRQAFGEHYGTRIREVRDPGQAAQGAQVLYTDDDIWTSMGQEAERERRLHDFQGYRVDERLIAAASPEVKVLHCLPAHRGEEITDAAIDHPGSLIFDQAENRLHAQKAILRLLLAEDPASIIAAARQGP